MTRIGASGRNTTIAKPRTAPTTPTRNVDASAIENALWIEATMLGTSGATFARADAGTLFRMAWPRLPVPVRSTEPPPENCWIIDAGRPTRASWAGTSVTIRPAKIVPATVRPTVPPICWKNVRLAVATPTLSRETAFCTTSVKTANDGPIPRPATTIHSQSIWRLVSARRPVMRNSPAARSRSEPSISSLYRPTRATTWPDRIALKIRAASRGRML